MSFLAGYREMQDRLNDEIARLRAELEDVRQQRETLKGECVALGKSLRLAQREEAKVSAEVLRLKDDRLKRQARWDKDFAELERLRAEVEHRREMLRRCKFFLLHSQANYAQIDTLTQGSYKTELQNVTKLLSEIELLDN